MRRLIARSLASILDARVPSRSSRRRSASRNVPQPRRPGRARPCDVCHNRSIETSPRRSASSRTSSARSRARTPNRSMTVRSAVVIGNPATRTVLGWSYGCSRWMTTPVRDRDRWSDTSTGPSRKPSSCKSLPAVRCEKTQSAPTDARVAASLVRHVTGTPATRYASGMMRRQRPQRVTRASADLSRPHARVSAVEMIP